jgi:hypothetical protein
MIRGSSLYQIACKPEECHSHSTQYHNHSGSIVARAQCCYPSLSQYSTQLGDDIARDGPNNYLIVFYTARHWVDHVLVGDMSLCARRTII